MKKTSLIIIAFLLVAFDTEEVVKPDAGSDENFILTDIDVEARSPGEISFAKGMRFKNVSIKSSGAGALRVRDSSDMDTKILF